MGVLYLVLTREKGHMTEVTVNVPVTLEIDNEFEVDDDGVAYVITLSIMKTMNPFLKLGLAGKRSLRHSSKRTGMLRAISKYICWPMSWIVMWRCCEIGQH